MEREENRGGQKAPKNGGAGGSGLRIPAFLMVPVGLGVGWAAGHWMGAILGGVIGFFLWRSRA